jgi:starch synthase
MANILFATSEARPLVKTGGLADVSGALPGALRDLGLDCRLLLPGYHSVLTGAINLREIWYFQDFFGHGEVRLLQGEMPESGVPVYVIDCPWHYLREGGPYQDSHGHDYADSAWRFAVLSRMAALLAGTESPLDWRPDLLHCNDWQTGLAPAYLRLTDSAATPSLMTIHNLAYQGVFPPSTVAALGLPASSFHPEALEYYGNLSFLKAGLVYADWISTVSPSYAREICEAKTGMGLQGLLSARSDRLTGILNGIDVADWNPLGDRHLPCRYSQQDNLGKRECKLTLQRDLNLEADVRAPLFGVISRLADQKGLDWVAQVAEGILQRGGQMAILGSGDKALEASFRDLAAHHPGRVATVIGYDEGLSHRIEAGADLFLMPSRFEPCGLNQMYSLRYGTVPIVHATGGLRDTVEDGVTGFVFDEPEAHALWQAIERALTAWSKPKVWQKLMQTGMQLDFSWEKSAREYAALYEKLIAGRG